MMMMMMMMMIQQMKMQTQSRQTKRETAADLTVKRHSDGSFLQVNQPMQARNLGIFLSWKNPSIFFCCKLVPWQVKVALSSTKSEVWAIGGELSDGKKSWRSETRKALQIWLTHQYFLKKVTPVSKSKYVQLSKSSLHNYLLLHRQESGTSYSKHGILQIHEQFFLRQTDHPLSTDNVVGFAPFLTLAALWRWSFLRICHQCTNHAG